MVNLLHIPAIPILSVKNRACLRGTSAVIHTTLSLFFEPLLCVQWQTFPTLICYFLAVCFDSVWKRLLQLALVSINDVIHCVSCHMFRTLKRQNAISLVYVPLWIQQLFCSHILSHPVYVYNFTDVGFIFIPCLPQMVHADILSADTNM